MSHGKECRLNLVKRRWQCRDCTSQKAKEPLVSLPPPLLILFANVPKYSATSGCASSWPVDGNPISTPKSAVAADTQSSPRQKHSQLPESLKLVDARTIPLAMTIAPDDQTAQVGLAVRSRGFLCSFETRFVSVHDGLRMPARLRFLVDEWNLMNSGGITAAEYI